jgi:hypothetical protein
MTNSTKVSLAVLAGALVLITVLLFQYGMSGPTFRAADYDNLQACVANIPQEWAPGSLERTRSEEACHYEARRRAQQGR